ncbi:MAG: hypothetical protein ACLTXL_06100 [Clostridia bacterium]
MERRWFCAFGIMNLTGFRGRSGRNKGAGWKLAQPVDFDLESLERKEYILEVTDTEEDFVVRVSSSMPGVRPSIFRVMRIQ